MGMDVTDQVKFIIDFLLFWIFGLKLYEYLCFLKNLGEKKRKDGEDSGRDSCSESKGNRTE
jgi:hypothetical protein